MTDSGNYWTSIRNRRLSRRRFVAGSGMVAAGSAAILAGCGDDDDDDDGDDATATSAGGTATGTATSASAGQRGGTLRLTKQQADDGIDPGLKVINNTEILTQIYNHTHLYKTSTNEFLLDAATAMEQPDDTTITFTLRDGMTFHEDGKTLTAEDVAFAWSRFPDLLANQGSQVNEANWGFIDTVTAQDAKTVVVKLKTPFASAPVLMASTAYGIVNKTMVEASPDKNVQQVDAGAGPRIIERRDATGTRTARFDGYYKHTNPSPHFVEDGPYIDAIETRIIVDRAAVKAAFLAGELDIMPSVADRIEFDEFESKDFVTAKEVETTEARFMAFDNVKFTDIKARQAISMAIDYEAMIASLYAGDGKYDGPVGVGLTSFALPQDTLEGYRKFDAAEAKKLWEAAGSPLESIRIEANQDPRGNTMAEFIATQLRANLGVDVEVLVHDTVTWVARAREPVKQWELFIVPYNFTNTPETYNMTMIDPGAFAGVSWSFAVDQPNSPEVQELAKEVRALVAAQSQELDPEARKQKMDEMQTFVLEELAAGINMPVPGHSYVVYNERLQNFPEDDYLTGLALRTQDMWIKA